MDEKEMTQKKSEVHDALKKIYDMAIYNDSGMGKDDYKEKTSFFPKYIEENVNGITVLKKIYEPSLQEPHFYVKNKGIIIEYIYGDWFNIKYRQGHLYIKKDPAYKGEEIPSISECLEKLNKYIEENHYYASYKATNKILDDYNRQLNKQEGIDLVNQSCIKNISVNSLFVTSNDIKKMAATFKNVKFFDTKNCVIDKNVSLYILPLYSYMDSSSSFDSLKVFDGAQFRIALSGSTFKNNFSNILHLDCEDIKLNNVNIDYNLFFLKTLAEKLKELTIESETPLNDKDLMFLSNFYNLEELDVYGITSNYDLLYKLDKLNDIPYHLFMSDEKELEIVKRNSTASLEKIRSELGDKFEQEFNVTNYLMNKRASIERQNQKFYKMIRVPRISKVKWGYMLAKDDKDIMDYLLKVSKMPIKLRKTIGTEDELKLIERKGSDYLEKLGFVTDINPDSYYLQKYHQTSIYGLDNNKLLGEVMWSDSLERERPFLDAKGKILCTFKYRDEQEINIPKHVEEVIYKKMADNDPNLTKYYNCYNGHSSKLEFLNDRLISLFQNLEIDNQELKTEYTHSLGKLIHQNNALALIGKYKDSFRNAYFSLMTTQTDDYGLGYESLRSITFSLDKIDNTKKLDSLITFFVEKYEFDDEENNRFVKDIYKYFQYNKKEQAIKARDITLDKIIEQYFRDCGIDIVSSIDGEQINEYFLEDIQNICLKYKLSKQHSELFKYYILYRQELYNSNLQHQICELENIAFLYEEIVGSYFSWPDFHETFEKSGLDGLLEKNMIDQKEYRMLCSLEMNNEMISQLKSKTENIYIRMIQTMHKYLDQVKALTLEDVLAIKDTIPIVKEWQYDKNTLYIDQIIRYITGDYPKWVKRDMEKFSKETIRDKEIVEVHRTIVNERKIKVKGIKAKISYEHSTNANPFLF